MTKRHSYIAAAAFSIAATAGMASWLALDGADLQVQAQPVLDAGPRAGVAETEAAVLPPPTPAELAEALPPQAPAAAQYHAPRLRPAPRVVAARTPAPAASAASTETPVEAETASSAAAAPALIEEPPYVEAESRYVEVTIPSNSVLGVRLQTAVSSETAEIEDRVEASVTRDVIADGRVAIPAGTVLLGSVNEVARGGKFKERARLGVRFHTLVLADGTRAAVRLDPVLREGSAPARQTAAKIGGAAVGGAIIGGIMGGKKGAILGGAAGAGAGAAVVAAGSRSIAALSSGSPLSVRLTSPVTIMIERNQ